MQIAVDHGHSFPCSLMKLQTSYKMSIFSLFISHMNLFFLSRLLKLPQFSFMTLKILIISVFSLLHENKKWISSSISPELHLVHTLSSLGMPRYHPFSILSWCADKRKRVKCRLWSKFLIIFRYFSQPKWDLNVT